MRAADRNLQHVANVAVGGTGLVYAVLKYLLPPADEFSLVSHPWQPHLQHMHVLAAPLLIFAVGLIWRSHVRANLSSNLRARRASGRGITLLFGPLVLTGVGVQILSSEGWRTWSGWLHTAFGFLWTAGYLWHQFSSRSR